MRRFRSCLALGLAAALAAAGCGGEQVELEIEPTTVPPGADRQIPADVVEPDEDGRPAYEENPTVRD